MRAYWKVLIQPPNLDATKQLSDFVGLEYTNAAKFYKPRFKFETRRGVGVRESAGTSALEYDASQRVVSVSVEQSDRKADMAKIVLFDPDNYLAENLETGLLVTVIGGWDQDGAYGQLFEGLIHAVTPSYKSGQRSTMTLTCLEKMIVMGADEVDMVKVTPSGAEDTDITKASAEAGGYADIIIATAKRNGLQCNLSDILLVPPFPKNKVKSPKQTAKATDLAHLFKLAKELYAAMWVDGDRLKFASLTKIFDTFTSELTFVFRDVGAEAELRVSGGSNDDLFEAARTKRVYIEGAAVTKGRPRKKVKVAAIDQTIASEDIQGAPTRTKAGKEIIGYRVNSNMISALTDAELDQAGETFSFNNIESGNIQWDTVKQYLVPIIVEHKPESETVEGTNKELPKADVRQLNVGINMDCTAGYWGIKPVAMVTVQGLGSKYSGNYYVSTVQHTLSQSGYKCRVKGLKVGT